MSGIRGKDTKPEMIIRRGLHALGFRYRLHAKGLAGKPDLVLPKYRAVIFVNGCFWHGHQCRLFKWPQTRPDFWRDKIGRNQVNDSLNLDRLRHEGWRVMVIWECALKGKKPEALESVICETADWLRGDLPYFEIDDAGPPEELV